MIRILLTLAARLAVNELDYRDQALANKAERYQVSLQGQQIACIRCAGGVNDD